MLVVKNSEGFCGILFLISLIFSWTVYIGLFLVKAGCIWLLYFMLTYVFMQDILLCLYFT